MKNNDFDAIIRIALRETGNEEVTRSRSFPLPPNYTPSNNLIRRIFDLNSKIRKNRIRTFLSRAAAIVIIVIIANLTISIVTGNDIIASTVRFIYTQLSGGRTSYVIPQSNKAEDSDKIITGVKLNYVPNGFIKTDDDTNNNSGTLVYHSSSNSNSWFILDYIKNPQKDNNSIDNEHSKLEHYSLPDGTSCDLYRCKKAGYYSMLVWSKNSTLFTLFIIDNLEGWEIDELKKIADKIDYVYKD